MMERVFDRAICCDIEKKLRVSSKHIVRNQCHLPIVYKEY